MALSAPAVDQWSLADSAGTTSHPIQYLDERSGTLLETPVTEEQHIQILRSDVADEQHHLPDPYSLVGADELAALPQSVERPKRHRSYAVVSVSEPSSVAADASVDCKPFGCVSCGSCFLDRLALAAHERSHDDGSGGSCDSCGRWLSSALHLSRHQRRHQLQQRRRRSGHTAGREAAEQGGRRTLRRRGRGPTRCGSCGEFFSGRALREHFAPHPRSGFYPCVGCGAAFAQACQLDRHYCAGPEPEPEPEPSPPPPAAVTRGPGRPRKRTVVEPKSEPVKEEMEDPAAAAEAAAGHAVKEEDEEEMTPVLEPAGDYGSHSEQEDADPSPPPAPEFGGDAVTTAVSGQQLQCTLCDRQFSSARNLRRHARTHANSQRLACEVCERVYSRLDSLVRHSIEAHQQRRELPCPRCRWRFTQKRILEYHLALHDAGAVREPRQKRRKYGRRRYRCSECRRGFTSEHDLATHSCSGAPSAIYVCDICGKAIKTKDWLSRHRLLHEATRPAKCGVCDRAFIDEKALQKHVKTHTDGRRFLCDVCGKGFTLKVTLQIHSRTHTGEKPFVCTTCEKPFTTRTQLYHHSKIHSGEKPYCCPVCGRAFRQSHHLKTHMRIHPGTTLLQEQLLPSVKMETLQPAAVESGSLGQAVTGAEVPPPVAPPIPMVVHPELPPLSLARHKLSEVYGTMESVQDLVAVNGVPPAPALQSGQLMETFTR